MLTRFMLPIDAAGLALAVVLAMAAPAAAQAPDPVKGARFADRWCTSCHVISGGQSRGTDVAPPFDRIAAKPEWLEENALFNFLSRPHRTMPDFSPSHRDVIDLIAFLKRQQP
ncbi:cytochrome c [Phreatobacter aquaticus]|uniref:Cytochrome c n=1 Tax=Phreatobacter aquaticus TaxID=2570229 RepID=A0A4D7QK22_9HYPH|nr:cytochrome c [Phreatobacter aquaticus]QCK87958.1 cytochrome c [Phreatobacter aquaticus]